MAKEIERKYLVVNNSYLKSAEMSVEIEQGYLSIDPDRTVRIRIFGTKGYLAVKTRNDGVVRNEWEYEIPVEDVHEMLRHALHLLTKTRYFIPAENGLFWEVDCFHGPHEGLVLAEIELPSADTLISLPSFVGEEVTDNPHYYNSNLASQV